jgi:hypothetical protein
VGNMDFFVKEVASMKWLKKLICKIKGHDWEIYVYSTGYYSYDVEKAGHCKRCGLDTHG